jgi:hypothetical protein
MTILQRIVCRIEIVVQCAEIEQAPQQWHVDFLTLGSDPGREVAEQQRCGASVTADKLGGWHGSQLSAGKLLVPRGRLREVARVLGWQRAQRDRACQAQHCQQGVVLQGQPGTLRGTQRKTRSADGNRGQRPDGEPGKDNDGGHGPSPATPTTAQGIATKDPDYGEADGTAADAALEEGLWVEETRQQHAREQER